MGRIRSQKGFTLVELGIVLMTIYRVIWGAILKGEELITNAKLKRVYNQFRQVLAAAYTY